MTIEDVVIACKNSGEAISAVWEFDLYDAFLCVLAQLTARRMDAKRLGFIAFAAAAPHVKRTSKQSKVEFWISLAADLLNVGDPEKPSKQAREMTHEEMVFEIKQRRAKAAELAAKKKAKKDHGTL